jgi:hypothetical protein
LCALAKRVVHLFTEPYTRYRRERGAIVRASATDGAAGPVLPEYSLPLSEACELLPETVCAPTRTRTRRRRCRRRRRRRWRCLRVHALAVTSRIRHAYTAVLARLLDSSHPCSHGFAHSCSHVGVFTGEHLRLFDARVPQGGECCQPGGAAVAAHRRRVAGTVLARGMSSQHRSNACTRCRQAISASDA